jgi:hypothetical protein
MLDNCGMNIANYDATLAGWATQTTVTNRTLGATGRQYCNTTDRNILINTPRNWTINGDALSGVCLPEINVQGNSVSITDGDLIPTTIDHTDFAVTGISTPIMRTFTIQNTGSATLNISSISNSNTTDFTVGTAPTTVSAGGSATFTVTLNSATTGTKNATITINNDDANEGAYDFAITGKVIFASPAVVCGNMLSLNDGVGGQYITIPHNTAYDGVNALTLEAWVYATNTNNQVVIHKWKTNQFTLEIFSDKLHFVLGGGLGFVASSANFPINQWVHCVGVFNGSQIRIYENGVLTGSVAASGTIPTDALAYDMTIGARSESADGYLSGNIDEVRIWNTARTQAEIRENMHLTSLGSESGLVGYYQFNETTGNAIDAVAGKNGTLQNGATRPESTVSVAKGVATRLTAPNGASTQTFGNATINFTAMSAPASNDEFVTYQLYDRPVNNVSATSTASNYWIVRQFGSQTFSYNQMNFTLPTSNVISTTDEGTPANFKLFKRATNSVGVWGTEIGTGTAANNTTKVITYNISPAQTSFSEFAVASTTSPLPITLLGLKGERVEGLRGEMTEEVKLEWSTGSEINNKGFEVEMSADGRNYEKIAFIEGKGNSTTIQPYSHTTIQPNDGYYRLKQVDFDGKFSYSPIIFIEGIDALKVYPNPNNGTFTISVGKNKLDSPARLLNAVGKEVWRGVQNEVRTTNLPTGVYFLHTVVAGKTNITKIVIKH